MASSGRKISLCFILLALAFTSQSQWKVFHYEARKGNVMSLLPAEEKLKDGYTFFGTSFNLDENVITKGYEPFLQNACWKTSLNKPMSSFKRCLYFNLYTKNVMTLNVCVHQGDSNCYEQKFIFSKDGYQQPFEWTLDESAKPTDTSYKHSCKQQADSPSFFSATIELKDSTQPFKFVIGDAKVYEKSYVKKPSQGYWFYELTGKKENKLPHFIRNKFGNNYPLQQDADFISFTGSGFNFELNDENIDSIGTQKATLQLIRSFFQKYPFYKEHTLNEHETMTYVDKLIADTLQYNDKIGLLEKKAKDFHDAHFYFKTGDKKELNISSPLILKRINGAIQVVGIRDRRLESKIDLGDKLYAIDDIMCEKFIDSLSNDYFGSLSERHELAISHLLEKPFNSSPYNITLEKPNGDLYNVELVYDKKYPVPAKFRPEHFGFRRMKDNWVYLKINRWDKGDWIKFYNLKDSVINSNGIVFDLRGNPGGFEIEPLNIASCFFKKPFVYSVRTYSKLAKTYSGETIVKPNNFLNLSKLRIIILVDNKTACASEAFALALKKANDAIIVGNSKTAGAFSTVYLFQLPGNISLFANVLSKSYMLNEKVTIEYTGIVPDVVVDINNYTDLYGYEDKVLQSAYNIIDRSSTHSNYSH